MRREIECVCYERKLRSLRRDKNLIVALNGLRELGGVLLRAVNVCHGIIYPRNEHVVLRRTWYPSFSPTTTESSLKALVLLCMPTVFRICCLLTHICAGVAIRFPPGTLKVALQLLGAFFVMLQAYCCTRLEVSFSPHVLSVECVLCMLCAVYTIALVVYGRSA